MLEPFADRLPLSREAVDRDGAARDAPGLLDALWADPATRVLQVHGTRGLVTEDGDRLDLRPPTEVARPELVLYLGRTRERSADGPSGTAVLAAIAPDPAAVEPDERRWADLRLAGAGLSARDAGLLTEAVALANWHRASGFSPRTGVATVATKAGWVRHPPGFEQESSGEHVFPRTDPAIIVGVVGPGDRLLLASNAAWPDGRFSVLAGFVEPGESFESAVEREVAEEVGVRVVATRYLGSQPWPFPASVMVGFLADADPGALDPVADGVEIREARWFSRDELAAAVEDGLKLPGHTSIARAIIEEWYGGRLAGDW